MFYELLTSTFWKLLLKKPASVIEWKQKINNRQVNAIFLLDMFFPKVLDQN